MALRTSVALCTYNGATHLQAQLDSIAAQTQAVDEIILCDDGSRDATVAIATAAQARGLPLHIYRNARRLGFVGNFAQAIARCSGAIIFLCDQDDVWYPHKVATLMDHFETDPATLLLFSDADLVNAHLEPLGWRLWQALPHPPTAQPSFNELMRHHWITGATCAFRRPLASLALPFPDTMVHDAWLGLVASAFGQVHAIPEPLIAYRQHGHNQIGLAPRTSIGKIKKLIKLISTPHVEHPEPYRLLADRIPPGTAHQTRLHNRIRHLENRLSQPRLPGIWREVRHGGYWQEANGWASVARDLILLLTLRSR